MVDIGISVGERLVLQISKKVEQEEALRKAREKKEIRDMQLRTQRSQQE